MTHITSYFVLAKASHMAIFNFKELESQFYYMPRRKKRQKIFWCTLLMITIINARRPAISWISKHPIQEYSMLGKSLKCYIRSFHSILIYFFQPALKQFLKHLLLSTIISVTNVNGIMIACCLQIENYWFLCITFYS